MRATKLKRSIAAKLNNAHVKRFKNNGGLDSLYFWANEFTGKPYPKRKY